MGGSATTGCDKPWSTVLDSNPISVRVKVTCRNFPCCLFLVSCCSARMSLFHLGGPSGPPFMKSYKQHSVCVCVCVCVYTMCVYTMCVCIQCVQCVCVYNVCVCVYNVCVCVCVHNVCVCVYTMWNVCWHFCVYMYALHIRLVLKVEVCEDKVHVVHHTHAVFSVRCSDVCVVCQDGVAGGGLCPLQLWLCGPGGHAQTHLHTVSAAWVLPAFPVDVNFFVFVWCIKVFVLSCYSQKRRLGMWKLQCLCKDTFKTNFLVPSTETQ